MKYYLSTSMKYVYVNNFFCLCQKSNENTFNSYGEVNIDEKQYKETMVFVLSDRTPSIDIVYNVHGYPEAKFNAALNRLADQKLQGKLLMENFGDFSFVGTGEIHYGSIETFYLTLNMDSDKLKLNKINIQIRTKPSSGGKGIEFTATTDNKNIVSGSADYTVKESGKTVIEGQGNIKIYDQQKTATFMFSRNNENPDGGLSAIFNANVGGVEKISSNLVLNTKNFHVDVSACEEANKCYKIEVKSILKNTELLKFNHELLIVVDLIRLGFDKEFHLKADTFREESGKFGHAFEMRLKSKDNVQYVYKVTVDNSKSSIELVLPKRTMALDIVYRIPKENVLGKYEASITGYLDKLNKPNSKSTLGFVGEIKTDEGNKVTSRGELKFAHPSLREFRIAGNSQIDGNNQKATGKLEIDIFTNPNQAILLNARYENSDINSPKSFNISYELNLKSNGLGIEHNLYGHAAGSLDRKEVSAGSTFISQPADLKAGIFFFGNCEKLELIVNGLNEEVINVQGSYDLSKPGSTANIKSTVKFLGAGPVVTSLVTDGYRSVKASLERGKLIKANAEFTFGKVASISVVGNGKDLIKGKLALDQQNFLESEYKVNEDDFKSFAVSVN